MLSRLCRVAVTSELGQYNIICWQYKRSNAALVAVSKQTIILFCIILIIT